jgi:EAL domain-containing protein (putative c-di-GMP-specific phosphodiesterase class I)
MQVLPGTPNIKIAVRPESTDLTDYASLSYLKKHFPIDTLKIDRAFVRNITTDPDDAAIVMAISMAYTLGIQTIAEDVETQEQLEFLRQHGCDAMQGYYFSHPIPVEEIAELLKGNLRLLPLRKNSAQ